MPFRITLGIAIALCVLGLPHRMSAQSPLDADDNSFIRWHKAVAEWRLAAERGDVDAQYRLCRSPVAIPDVFQWCLRAAEQGHAGAQLETGDRYRFGGGTKKDIREALRWFELAATNGNAEAAFLLGSFYWRWPPSTQNDFTPDDALALRWLCVAAESGHPDAARRLGHSYLEQGHGVPHDTVEASKWFEIALHFRGSSLAANNASVYEKDRDELVRQMTAEQIEEARIRAEEWLATFGLASNHR